MILITSESFEITYNYTCMYYYKLRRWHMVIYYKTTNNVLNSSEKMNNVIC